MMPYLLTYIFYALITVGNRTVVPAILIFTVATPIILFFFFLYLVGVIKVTPGEEGKK